MQNYREVKKESWMEEVHQGGEDSHLNTVPTKEGRRRRRRKRRRGNSNIKEYTGWRVKTRKKLLVAEFKWAFPLLRGGADKSLARSGRKQATATKLGIYSTYSQRSSIHFLARCPNFCKPLKKKSGGCPSNQVSAAAMTSAPDEKWWSFNCFFSPGNMW